jgi:glutathione-regulated potassium-efflux system ancillary protein KefF
MILIVHAHPYAHHSRAGKALLAAVRGLPEVAVRDLYELYPDFYIDVAAEQAALSAARTIVWQHPLYWYHAPALMVLWLEKVLTLDWAYGAQHALDGKRLLWVTTTGGPEDAYLPHPTRASLDELAAPLKRTASFCQMRWLPPLAVHRAGALDDDRLLASAEIYRDRLVAELHHLRGGAARG